MPRPTPRLPQPEMTTSFGERAIAAEKRKADIGDRGASGALHEHVAVHTCMATTCTLIDANNVRGTMRFPDLAAFSSAVKRWCKREISNSSWALLAIDHGARAEAYALSPILAVAFAGLKTDADTVIVQAVNWLLLTNSEIRIHVVSSDHLLRQRCTHELPTCRGEPFGEKRPRDQLSRISFEDSLSFGKCLDAARHPSPTDTFAASPLRARQPSLSDGDTATMSKGARRRAKHRAEKRVMGSADERTYQRERAALELHERVDRRAAAAGPSRHGAVSAYCHWYSTGSVQPTPGDTQNGHFAREEVALDDLCCYSRLRPDASPSLWSLLLLLYLPIGIALLVVRCLLLLIAALLLVLLSIAKEHTAICKEEVGLRVDEYVDLILSGLCYGLGFLVRLRHADGGGSEAAERALLNAQVLVANHVGQFDGLPIRTLTPCATLVRETYTHGGASGGWWARLLTKLLVAPLVSVAFAPIAVPTPASGAADEAEAASGRARVRAAMRSRKSAAPLLIFPEGSITNGRVGLLRFSQSAFTLGASVTPIALRLRVLLPLEADTIWSPLGANVLWTLFQPYHYYELTVLRPIGDATTCTPEHAPALAADAAARIASTLGIVTTGWTTRDKAQRSAQAKALGKAKWLEAMRM